MKIEDIINILKDLAKIRITTSVTFTVLVGYIMAKAKLDIDVIWSLLGVFLLSAGSSAYNHFQEGKYDKLMRRTMNRPIPKGILSSKQVFYIASILALSGLWVLLEFTNIESLILGIFAIVLYNLIYTPLKRVTSFAVIPGALIGSIPPMIGYTAAGGYYFSNDILALAVFIFIWQMPHFWLLLMIYDDDYKVAGYPTLTSYLNLNQLKRVTYSWLIGLVASSVVMVFFADSNLMSKLIVSTIYLIAGTYMLFSTKYIINQETDFVSYKNAFKKVNYFVLAVVLLLTINKLI